MVRTNRKLNCADSLAATLKGAGDDAIVVPGKPDESTYTRVVLPADHDDRMPPKGTL